MSALSNKIRAEKIDACYLCGSSGFNLLQEMEDRLFGVPGSWNYKRCNTCGLNWLTPRPQDLVEVYINYYTHDESESPDVPFTTVIRFVIKSIAAAAFDYPKSLNNKLVRILGRLLSWIGPIKEVAGRSVMWLRGGQRGRLLDVGCGNGLFLAHMQNFGWQVSGIEPDPDAVRSARERYGLQDIYIGSLENVEIKKNSFDAVTMNHVIEHLPDPVQTLKQCWYVLRPGGQLVLTTPNAESLGRHLFKRNWRGWEPPRHLFLFDSQTLASCAQKADILTYKIESRATTAFYIWLFGCRLRKTRTLSKSIPEKYPKIRIFQAFGFWMLEYLINYFWPCGEELVLSARKPLG